MLTRKDYLLKKVSHQEYYGQFVTAEVRRLVEKRISRVAIVNSTDPHFNDISLSHWDRLHYSLVVLCNLGTGVTLSDTISIAKEAARQIKENEALK